MSLFLTLKENMIAGGTLADKCHIAAGAGFSGFDFMGGSLTAQLSEAKVALTAAGLKPAAVYSQMGQPGTSLIGGTSAERSGALDLMKQRLEATAEVGAGRLIFVPRFGTLDIREEAAEPILAAMLDELAEWAAGLPVVLVMEPLNRNESRFLHDPLKALRICKAVNHPNIQTMVDTYHMAVESQVMETMIQDTAPYLGLVHLSDSERKLPGQGDIDFYPVLQTIRRIGYEGPLGFECAEADAAALRRSVEWLNGIWNRLEG